MLQISHNIKLIRLLANETQAEFGSRFSLNVGKMKSYEAGKALPDALSQSRMAEFAGITIEELNNKKLEERDIKVKKVEKITQTAPDMPTKEFPVAIIEHLLSNNDKLITIHDRMVKTHEDLVLSHKDVVSINTNLVQKLSPNSKDIQAQKDEFVKKLWLLIDKHLLQPGVINRETLMQELDNIDTSHLKEVPIMSKS